MAAAGLQRSLFSNGQFGFPIEVAGLFRRRLPAIIVPAASFGKMRMPEDRGADACTAEITAYEFARSEHISIYQGDFAPYERAVLHPHILIYLAHFELNIHEWVVVRRHLQIKIGQLHSTGRSSRIACPHPSHGYPATIVGDWSCKGDVSTRSQVVVRSIAHGSRCCSVSALKLRFVVAIEYEVRQYIHGLLPEPLFGILNNHGKSGNSGEYMRRLFVFTYKLSAVLKKSRKIFIILCVILSSGLDNLVRLILQLPRVEHSAPCNGKKSNDGNQSRAEGREGLGTRKRLCSVLGENPKTHKSKYDCRYSEGGNRQSEPGLRFDLRPLRHRFIHLVLLHIDGLRNRLAEAYHRKPPTASQRLQRSTAKAEVA